MKVLLTTDRAGRAFQQREGEIVDLSPAEAHALVAAGQAEYAEPEAAALTHERTATIPRAKPRIQR